MIQIASAAYKGDVCRNEGEDNQRHTKVSGPQCRCGPQRRGRDDSDSDVSVTLLALALENGWLEVPSSLVSAVRSPISVCV